MSKTDAGIIGNIEMELCKLIAKRNHISELDALRLFMKTKTYQMLIDDETKLWHFAPLVIYDIWENEELTGDPGNSLYLRGDEIG